MPSATDIIMATLPAARAGVGSAVNDTVRELGGALGVAVIGSIAATGYGSSLATGMDRLPSLPDTARTVALDNVGGALQVSQSLGVDGAELASLARSAFVDSITTGLWFAAGMAFLATILAWRHLPQTAAAHGHAGHGQHHAPAAHTHAPVHALSDHHSRI